ncbi:MAG: hypothetical protein EAZ15_02900 [Sphingobacteriales bacterium]|nr:MAG: hypothetical protein EAZ15_02900 [Sphingobacteriales bacterium]
MNIFKKNLTFVLLCAGCLIIVGLIFMSTNYVEGMQIIFILILYFWSVSFKNSKKNCESISTNPLSKFG